MFAPSVGRYTLMKEIYKIGDKLYIATLYGGVFQVIDVKKNGGISVIRHSINKMFPPPSKSYTARAIGKEYFFDTNQLEIFLREKQLFKITNTEQLKLLEKLYG